MVPASPSGKEETMLTRKDIDDLFDLLAIFRPNDAHLADKRLRSAWLLVLSPYSRDDVREAVGAWFRKSKYWPEPAEIAALCPPLPEGDESGTARLGTKMQFSPAEAEEMKALWAAWDKVVLMRREAGVPATCLEAKQAGLSDREWHAMLEKAGLEFPVGCAGLALESGREAAGL